MSYREHIGDEDVELVNLKSKICSNDLMTCSIWRYVRLAKKSARLIKLWRRRVKSKVGGELLKICDHWAAKNIDEHLMIDFLLSAMIRVPHDNGFESSKRGKCSLCRQKESKHKNLEIRKQLYESRLDHTPKCQSWATSVVGYRSLKKFYKEDHLDHVMSLLNEAHEFLLSDARRCLELLGGSVLPFEIQETIIQMSLRKDQKVNRSLTDDIRMLGTAVYLVHESLYILLGNDDSITWSTLSYLSRVAILRKALDRIKCQVAYKINRPLSNDSSISPCVYSWPWVALRKDSRLHLHNVQTQELIRLRSERIYNLDHVVSFCVCANLICVIETNNRNFPKYSNDDTDYRSADSDSDSMKSDSSNNNSLHASSIKVFSLYGKFLYSLQLYDISLQFDPADQPIRLFQREKNTDSILLVIERENNLLPSIHQDIGVISLDLGYSKEEINTNPEFIFLGQQGALLDFLAFEDSDLQIWHPTRSKTMMTSSSSPFTSFIGPVNSEIVQIRSKYGEVSRAVSPRVKPKSYHGFRNGSRRSRSSNHARLTRHYKINASGSHFCEISHAGRLIRVSEAKGNVLFEFNPDNVLHGEKQDSRVLAADCVWPHLLLVIEYDEIIWTSHGEEQTSFQSVIIGRISEGNFEQITVLDVSRNDYQFENTSLKKISLDSSLSYDDWKIGSFSDLNIAVPNRNPIGETSLHLPVRLTGKSATIVYADHTIVVHDLNPTLSQS